MKSTVGRQLSTRPIEKDDFVSWASREANPLLKALKVFADSRYSTHIQTTTANTGVLTQIWEDDMPQDSAWTIEAAITAFSATAQRFSRRVVSLFHRSGSAAPVATGGATLVNVTSSGAFDAALSAVGNGVQLQVNDGSNGITAWDAVITIQEAQ